VVFKKINTTLRLEREKQAIKARMPPYHLLFALSIYPSAESSRGQIDEQLRESQETKGEINTSLETIWT
jgi:hypothetical protein